METITKTTGETKDFGRKVATSLKKAKGNAKAIVLALKGELGSGKTTFVQGLAAGLGVTSRVVSPTFIILKKYKDFFYHIDLYRLESNVWSELSNLGLTEILSDPTNVVVIEWADKVKDSLPAETIWIEFEESEGGRKIKSNQL